MYLFEEHLKTKLNVRLVKRFFYLQQFTFFSYTSPSETMAPADALSRLPSMQLDDENRLNEAIPDKLFKINHFPSKLK